MISYKEIKVTPLLRKGKLTMLPAAAHFMTGGAQQPVRTVMRSDYSPDTNPVPSPQNSVFRTNLVPPNTQSYAPQTAYSRSIVPQVCGLINEKHPI